MRFEALLKQARQRSGLTQQQIADEVGDALGGVLISQQTVSLWCRGRSMPGDRRTWLALMQVLWRYGGLSSLEAVNTLLLAAEQGALHDQEIETWFAHLDPAIKTVAGQAADQTSHPLLSHLPSPTYQHYVGGGHNLQHIQDALATKMERQRPIFITGLGGIGKTSLTREALERWLRQGGDVQEFAWTTITTPSGFSDRFSFDQALSALGEQLDVAVDALPTNEHRLKALAQRLAGAPALVVVDNVETPAEVEIALSITRRLSPVAQVLVTSRRRIDYPAGLAIVLTELPERDAMELLRLETLRLGLGEHDAEVLHRIYKTVGGNPQALKLVVAQLRYLPIERILTDFSGGSQTAKALFAHIYETAWNLLSERAQQAMLGLWMLPTSGADWWAMRMAVEANGEPCSDGELQQLVNELNVLNLIQVATSPQPHYTLHRLTYHFLESQLGLVADDD